MSWFCALALLLACSSTLCDWILFLSHSSYHSNASEQEPKTSCIKNTDHNADKLLSELVTLEERNKLMESELKEMQERYSEISLKFAEVEGERQQLVMTLRNLKNARKS